MDIEEKWDTRWREKAQDPNLQADPWLKEVRPLLHPGTALDIACGRGRNALYLAQEGFEVTAVDISAVALDLLHQQAQQRQLAIATRKIDLEQGGVLPAGPFDLLLNFFYLHRPLIPQELERVRPGGIAVFRTFSQAGCDRFGEIKPEIALAPGELLNIFSGWNVLHHEEGLEPSAKGGSLAGIVARRPDVDKVV